MMKKVLLGAVAIAAAAISGSALAADMAYKVKAPPPVVYDWTGFYIGGNIGGGFDGTTTGFSGSPATAPFFGANINPTSLAPGNGGIIGGFQAGYNYEVSRMWVVGVEADIQGSGYKGNSSVTPTPTVPFPPVTTSVENHSDYFGTVRARAGWLATPSFLIYGTGGFAYAREEASFSLAFPGTPPFLAAASTTTKYGYAAGAGFEIMSVPHWMFRVEYLYLGLGNISATGTLFPGFTFTATQPVRESVLRAGLSYKF
jgi:outer membrane immunogenic protein